MEPNFFVQNLKLFMVARSFSILFLFYEKVMFSSSEWRLGKGSLQKKKSAKLRTLAEQGGGVSPKRSTVRTSLFESLIYLKMGLN